MYKNQDLEETVSSSDSRNPIKELRDCVLNWERFMWDDAQDGEEGIPIKYLYYYFPASRKDGTEEEWNIREYIYDFREGCGEAAPQQDDAPNLVRHEVEQLLVKTFGEQIRNLTFVCMPCSSDERYVARYKWFCKTLCDNTGMENGFDHIIVIGKTKPSHLGGTETEVVAYDNDWFKGKVVLLFDDILNKGNHIRRYKRRLEEEGATVIGALFLARVTSTHEAEQPAGLILRVLRDKI